ncbi:MAG: N-glycosylase/DNA lyase [Candidatus Pacearchaeota archaeon]
MRRNYKLILELKNIYKSKRKEIIKKLLEFKYKGLYGSNEDIFAELCFCILTPQSKAKRCWETVEKLKEKNLLIKGNASKIKKKIFGIRFRNKKARYIVEARKFFLVNGKIKIKEILNKFDNIEKCRDWLVKNLKGIGYKEASHFLRNIGKGEKFAILDRHILKNLKSLGLIKEIPNLNKKTYLFIENEMKKISKNIRIPISHLDLLLWYKETGEIFK